MEVINDLVGYDNLKIFQDDEWFRFSLESVLLPDFVKINLRDKMIIDLCTGNAPIPLILSTKTKAKIYGVEIQTDIYELGEKSVKINYLEDQIILINDDVKKLKNRFPAEMFDLITVNPPYFKYNSNSIMNDDYHKTVARHEISLCFDDILSISRYLLRTNGRLAFVQRTERFMELLNLVKKNGFTIKKMQFIYPRENEESKLFMMEITKNGNEGLKLLPPLFIHHEDGTYRDEILQKFKKGD